MDSKMLMKMRINRLQEMSEQKMKSFLQHLKLLSMKYQKIKILMRKVLKINLNQINLCSKNKRKHIQVLIQRSNCLTLLGLKNIQSIHLQELFLQEIWELNQSKWNCMKKKRNKLRLIKNMNKINYKRMLKNNSRRWKLIMIIKCKCKTKLIKEEDMFHLLLLW